MADGARILMAKIVDVTDVPEFPGAGMLVFDDGRPPLLALPEIADEHRERLGMSAMREGVAGPGAPDPDAWKNHWGGTLGNTMHGEQQPVSVAAPAPQPPPSTPAPTPEPPSPGPQSAEGTSPPAPPADPNAEAMAASDARMREALRTGRTPGGAPQPVTPAGFSPESNKVVTEKGPAYDPEAARDRLAAAGMVLDAQMAKAASDKETADAQLSDATAKNLAAQQAVAQQNAAIQRKQMAFQQQDARLQQDLADYTESAKPDPNRYWSTPGGAFSGMLSIIGQGLGAFGATIGHTDNWAFQAAQKKIQLEMAAQQEAYDAGRGDRKNALARLTEYYHGDIDMAKLALQQALNKVAETETLKFGAMARSKDIASNAQVLAAKFQEQQLLNEQARADLAAGKTTTTSEEKWHKASGGGDGSKRLTFEQELALRKGLGPKGLAPKDEVHTEVDYGGKKRDLLEARQSVEEEAKAYGLTYNRETGEILTKDGKPVDPDKLSIPGVGRVHMPASGLLSSEAARAVRRARLKTTSAYRKAITGVAFSPQEAKEAEEATHGETETDALRTLQERAANLAERDRAIDSEYPAHIVENYRQRQAETNIQRANRAGSKPKVTPYSGRADDEADE